MISADEALDRMMEQIKDQELKKSLKDIRDFAEDFWTADNVVSDFTDHGIKHSNRLIVYSYQILQSEENNKKLNEIETYLLLASIYLHDIGMQCYPEEKEIRDGVMECAKEIADKKIGPFNIIDLESKSAMQLNDDQKKFIREYHNLLTSAMILYSSNNTYPDLDSVCQTIPSDFRADLADICLYHSKYPIMECEESLSPPYGKKRLIATILRLADELDIGNNRVKDSDLKRLKKDPDNLFYFIKHSYTTVYIVNDEIRLLLTLDPEDADKYGHMLQTSIINYFCCKNKKLIKILNTNHYKIKIGDEDIRKKGDLQIKREIGRKKLSKDTIDRFKLLERKNKQRANFIYRFNIADFYRDVKDVLNNNSPYNILVIGDVMLDSFMYVTNAPYYQVATHEKLPKPGLFVLLTKENHLYQNLGLTSSERCSLGGTADLAAALLTIPNVHVDTIGVIGNDHEGNEIKELFQNLQNKTKKNDKTFSNFDPIVIDKYPTVVKQYYHCVTPGQGPSDITNYRFDREDPKFFDKKVNIKEINEYNTKLKTMLDTNKTNYNCIIINDHEKGMINKHIIDLVSQKYQGVPIFIDPKYNFNHFKELHIKTIIPNIKEASMGIQRIADISTEDIEERVSNSDLLDEDYNHLNNCLPNCDSFVIKSDQNGAMIYSKNENGYYRDHIYPYPIAIDESKVKSTIGCGDTFDAYFIISQLKNHSLQNSVKIANIAAGIKRKKELGEVVSPKEIDEELNIFKKKCPHECKND